MRERTNVVVDDEVSSYPDRQSSTRRASVSVVGLGYVGLPLAVEFDRAGHDVVGYDIDVEKVESLEGDTDPTGEIGDTGIEKSEVEFVNEAERLGSSDYLIITVPTPIDDLKNPDLEYVRSAGESVSRHIDEGTTVILESTVYPGATREVLVPAIEENSSLTSGEDFYVGYSPERMVPGDDEHGLSEVVKIVSGQNEDVLDDIAELYDSIVDAGVHKAPEIEVAEAAKCIENIQRDINIALVNELAIACDALDLDTQAVLDAAGTKWNFHDYRPGLVGGHCIPVDPFFMIYESERNGFTPKLIEQAREVNEYMPEHVADLTLRGLNDCGNVLRDSTVLVLGLSYKAGVGDIRTSVVDATVEKLESYGVDVIGYDPYVTDTEVRDEFGIDVQEQLTFDGVDGILLATPHEPFLELEFEDAARRMAENPLIVDVMGTLNGRLAESDAIAYRRV